MGSHRKDNAGTKARMGRASHSGKVSPPNENKHGMPVWDTRLQIPRGRRAQVYKVQMENKHRTSTQQKRYGSTGISKNEKRQPRESN